MGMSSRLDSLLEVGNLELSCWCEGGGVEASCLGREGIGSSSDLLQDTCQLPENLIVSRYSGLGKDWFYSKDVS